MVNMLVELGNGKKGEQRLLEQLKDPLLRGG